jgi:hypothetical protein
MTQALLDRLDRVLDVTVKDAVMALKQPQGPQGPWVAPPPNRTIADVHVFVLHETSGWSARTGSALAQSRLAGPNANGGYPQFLISGDGTVFETITAIESPPRLTWHANFTNGWAIGSETGHGWSNYVGNYHVGPHSESRQNVLANGNLGPGHGAPLALHPIPRNHWIPLSGVREADDAAHPTAADPTAGPDVDDVPGLKCWIRHVSFNEVVVGWWTTARYAGPWRQPQRLSEMVFSEAQYRSWALLLRYSAEKHLIPRNFLLIPHKTRGAGAGTTPGGHEMIDDAASFAAIVRADEVLSRSLRQLASPAAALTEAELTAGARYRGAVTTHGNNRRNRMWTNAMGLYRGFHGHGTSGDPDAFEDHDCPGPMFDWFRVAREVWDWWWHPFDFNAARTSTVVDRRPYSTVWNGGTRLTEHYYDTPAQSYRDRRFEGMHREPGSPATYRLEQGSRVYALATGELVASRFPAETGRVSLAFMVVRHEVYHQLHPRAGQPAAAGQPAVSAGRINYGVEPSTVYTLYMHLGRPAGMTFDRVDPANPDWLNRLLMRKKEADLGVAFRNANHQQPAGWVVPNANWNGRPPGGDDAALRARALRPTISEGWTADARQLGRMVQGWNRGDLVLASTDPWSMPVKVLLGDFLGTAGVIVRTEETTLHGVRVEVFSRNVISPDFTLTTTDEQRGWAPVGATPSAVRYPSEWERTPQALEKLWFEALGVEDTSLMAWFADLRAATNSAPVYPDDGRLPDAEIVHYDPDQFMAWINDKTWRSEWPKYRLPDPLPAAPRLRPLA